MVMAILASPHDVDLFIAKYGLLKHADLKDFGEVLASTRSGVAEVVIPPGSKLIGKSARDVWLRKTYGQAMVALHRRGETLREGEDIRNLPLEAGDTLVVHTTWEALARLESNRDFVVVTSEYPHEETRPQKVGYALFFFLVALGLVLFSDLRLSISLLTGALGMVLSGVMNIDELESEMLVDNMLLVMTYWIPFAEVRGDPGLTDGKVLSASVARVLHLVLPYLREPEASQVKVLAKTYKRV